MAERRRGAGTYRDDGSLLVDVKGPTDPSTGAIEVVQHPHHDIHAGTSFTCHYSVTTANSDDDVTVIGFSTANTTTWGHIVVTISASDPAEFFIYENNTIATPDQGTDLTIFNRNRNSGNTSGFLTLETSPEVNKATSFTEGQYTSANVTPGTEIEHVLLAGGMGPRAVGGSDRSGQEWMLDQNQDYLFVMQNVGASVNTHVISLNWYEHANIA